MGEVQPVPTGWRTEGLYPRHKRAVAWALEDARGGRLLDVGCNDGVFGAFARENGFYVVGLDSDASFAPLASSRLDEFHVLDAAATWPFDDGSFDVVHLGAVIQIVYDYPALLRQVHRALRPRGVVIVSTPNIAHYRHRVQLLLGRVPSWYGLGHFDHIRMWTLRDLARVLTQEGFVVTRQAGVYEREGFLCDALARLLPTFASIIMLEARKAGTRQDQKAGI